MKATLELRKRREKTQEKKKSDTHLSVGIETPENVTQKKNTIPDLFRKVVLPIIKLLKKIIDSNNN